MTTKPIRVLIVDDSALMRQILTSMLSSDPMIEVVGTAPDPYVARQKIKELNPDVLTLDIEMPRMDGLQFLDKIMALHPMPVVMVSSLTQEGADATIRALEGGAIDFVAKPTADLEAGLADKKEEITSKVKTAAKARVRGRRKTRSGPAKVVATGVSYSSTEKIIAIGASTGGVEALTEVVCSLPADSPATLITQHMPARFTTSFANRLNGISKVAVAEATDGTRILPGHVYIAPGGHHLELTRSGANYVCRITGTEPVSGHCPSVDVLFNSVATVAGANAIGVILTGMGKDGAAGLYQMSQKGAATVGQNEASCVVYGMPKVAFEMGAVGKQLPLEKIAQHIIGQCSKSGIRSIRV